MKRSRLREGLIDPSNTGSDVWADSAYRTAENERFLREASKVSRIHRRKPKGKLDTRKNPLGSRERSDN